MTKLHLAAFAALLAAAAPAAAATFSLGGSFAVDNGKAAYSFYVAQTGIVTLTSFGYAGGTNGNGDTIARGGFDPVFSLYDNNGTAIDFNDDGNGVPLDAVTGVGADPLLSLSLDAGRYFIYLTQYNNFGPLQFPGFFAFDGQPDFRGGFVDFYGDQRTGNWSFDIDGASAAIAGGVPETATWLTMIIGFGLAGAAARRRRGDFAAA